MSESNQVQLRYVSEGTYGTTPTDSSNWQELGFTEESLTGEQEKRQSALVENTRIIADKIEVRRTVGGSFGFELRYGWYDDFILAALCGSSWSADVATLGTTDYSFSVEKEFGDLSSGNRFILFDGMRIGGMSLNISHGDVVTGSFTMAGATETSAATSAVGSGSEASLDSTKKMMASATGFGSFKIDDSANAADIMSLTFEVNNNHEPRFALGSIGPSEQDKGDGVVTGVITAYLDETSLALFDRARNNTDTEIDFTLSDAAGNSYAFNLPKTIITAATPRSQGRNQRVMTELSYEAITSAMTITRSAA
jgi:hypothetical protein